MKKIALVLVFLVLAASLFGCAEDTSKTIVVFNWEDYIDPALLEEFEQETGYKVKYLKFTTNEDMYIKMTKAGSAYDVVFPSDYIIERLIDEDLLETLDYSKIPNSQHLFDWLKNPDYDPANAHSLPYMWGTVGVLYNIDKTGEDITSWTQLWDIKYDGEVCMMDSMRDTIGVTLKMLGYSVNEHDEVALGLAKEKLIEQKTSGVLLAYGVDDIKDKLINNECAIGLVWSGDAVYAMGYNESLRYSVPEEGSNVWVDGMVIPKNAPNKEGAYALINFLSRPDVAMRNSEYIGYSTPNETAMGQIAEEYKDNAAFNPPADVIDRCEWFHALGEFTSTYEMLWTEITAQ